MSQNNAFQTLTSATSGAATGLVVERPYFDASSQNACDTREWLGRLEFAINGNYAKLTKDAAVIRLADGDIVHRAELHGAVPPKDTEDDSGNRPKRGKVAVFSRKSRKRLLDEFNQLDKGKVRSVAFLTLTFPDTVSSEPRDWKEALEAFRRRLERRYPHMSAVWRAELQKRKSGSRVGEVLPHYHLIVFGLAQGRNINDAVLKAELLSWMPAAWTEISGAGRAGLDIKVETSWRRVFAYIAKYVAKSGGGAVAVPEGFGRHWGRFKPGKLPWSAKWVCYVSSRSQFRVAGFMKFLNGIPADANYSLPTISAYISPDRMLDWLEDNGVAVMWGEIEQYG